MDELYKIIADRDELLRFIDWLPETSDDCQYYLTLLARKKYLSGHPALKSDKTMIKRFTSSKNRLANKIAQLETRIGTYLGHDDIPVPPEAMALYITPSPRDFRKVAFRVIQVFAEKLEKAQYLNPRQEVMNQLQTTPVTDAFHVFDIDSKNPELYERCLAIVGGKCHVIETRGGYHLILKPKEITQDRDWYPQLKALADVTGDALVPVPGCYQGGYIPRMIK